MSRRQTIQLGLPSPHMALSSKGHSGLFMVHHYTGNTDGTFTQISQKAYDQATYNAIAEAVASWGPEETKDRTPYNFSKLETYHEAEESFHAAAAAGKERWQTCKAERFTGATGNEARAEMKRLTTAPVQHGLAEFLDASGNLVAAPAPKGKKAKKPTVEKFSLDAITRD